MENSFHEPRSDPPLTCDKSRMITTKKTLPLLHKSAVAFFPLPATQERGERQTAGSSLSGLRFDPCHQAHQVGLGKILTSQFAGDFTGAHDDDAPAQVHDLRQLG